MDLGRRPRDISSASASGYVLRDPAFELNCFLTRSVYLVSWRSCWAISAPTKGRDAIALAARRSERRQCEDRRRLA
jgi:hypothetical protein